MLFLTLYKSIFLDNFKIFDFLKLFYTEAHIREKLNLKYGLDLVIGENLGGYFGR